eukprot:Mycagemm_TRINITY_DN10366_c2_g3::TRINITY_DN10366_c2_g3_i2::g.916::m.916 type:complete len:113 gc:universal TRINITY_DN10366_c2_g3_i2:352-14(-)
MGAPKTRLSARLLAYMWLLDALFLTLTGLTMFFYPERLILHSEGAPPSKIIQLLGASVSTLGALLWLIESDCSPSIRFAVSICFLLFHAQAASVQRQQNMISTLLHLSLIHI